ncbi:MAG: hypothetical protein R2697_18940 [Ilumatobacteraceae bacterium]
MLLYVTNLVAIVGIGALTMVAVGFVPTSLLTRSWHTLGTTTVISLILIGAISWPLWHTAERAAREARVTSELEAVVGDWLGAVPSLEADSIERNGRSVTIDVVGPVEPPPADELSRAIVARLDDRYDVRVRWAQRIDRPVGQGDEELDESPIDAMGEVVDEWLVAVERPDLSIEAITMSGSDVVVRVVGPRKPPSGAVLRELIADRFPETEYVASVAWTQISVIDDQTATLDAPDPR